MDNYRVSEKEVIKLAFFLINMGKLDKPTVLRQAEEGNVPSGFDNSRGYPRVSWCQEKDIADVLISEIHEAEKETKENVSDVPPLAPKTEEKKPFDFGKKKKKK